MKAPKLHLERQDRRTTGLAYSTSYRGRWKHDGEEHGVEWEIGRKQEKEIGVRRSDELGFQMVVDDYIKWLNETIEMEASHVR